MKYIFSVLATTVLLGTTLTTAFAETEVSPASVSKFTCNKLANTTHPFILVLNSNEDLIESISQCAKDAKLMGASVSGLGQLHNPVLAYFSSDPKAKPALTKFKGFYELGSLNGNITNNDGKYYTHLHAVLADKNFHGIAGHINSAQVGLTAEITITPFKTSLQRTVDPKTGFGPIVN